LLTALFDFYLETNLFYSVISGKRPIKHHYLRLKKRKSFCQTKKQGVAKMSKKLLALHDEWQELREELFTPEELAASEAWVAKVTKEHNTKMTKELTAKRKLATV